ncbi:hypothetical protein AAT19DRAFT_9477 [Rhodotorula toruloides]|uniref:Zn(2)-C6 fungal-type domain-containing protein n=1 Tax=Rhodotorula toruloides TaxID=5286 RepID=A0A2T0A299_RHOTO|nr:hypothetical protein AAT19DRAFT_9477 [Rhodotorula toruloides]
MTSPADSQAPRARGKRGPAASSCDACRRRRIACRRRSGDSNGPCESCEKKGFSCAFGGQASGRLALVKPSTPPLLAGPSRADNRLALEELDSAFGFELLSLYDGVDGRSSALYPLPIWDYSSLRSRFQHAGNRLCELSKEDQVSLQSCRNPGLREGSSVLTLLRSSSAALSSPRQCRTGTRPHWRHRKRVQSSQGSCSRRRRRTPTCSAYGANPTRSAPRACCCSSKSPDAARSPASTLSSACRPASATSR